MVSKKTIAEQEAFDRRVRRAICGTTGATISSIAKKYGCGWHTVERSIKRLEEQGKIRCIDKCASPRIYEDGEGKCDPYKVLGKGLNGDLDESHSPPMSSGEGKAKDGRFKKTTRAHITGNYTVPIIKGGEVKKAIRDKDGFTIGYWNVEPKKLNASVYYSGAISIPEEQIKFNAYQSKEGEWTTLSIYPNPRRVYYANATVEAYRVMGEQAELVTKILSEDGWKFDGIPTFNGTMHYGEINPELLRYAGRSFKEDCDNASLHADHSVPEGELEIYEDPFDKQKTQDHINIIFDLPERLLNMERNLVHLYRLLDKQYELSQKNAEINQSLLTNIQLQSTLLAEMGIIQGEGAMKTPYNKDDRTGYQ